MKNVNVKISDNTHSELAIIAAKYRLSKNLLYRLALEYAASEEHKKRNFQMFITGRLKLNEHNN